MVDGCGDKRGGGRGIYGLDAVRRSTGRRSPCVARAGVSAIAGGSEMAPWRPSSMVEVFLGWVEGGGGGSGGEEWWRGGGVGGRVEGVGVADKKEENEIK